MHKKAERRRKRQEIRSANPRINNQASVQKPEEIPPPSEPHMKENSHTPKSSSAKVYSRPPMEPHPQAHHSSFTGKGGDCIIYFIVIFISYLVRQIVSFTINTLKKSLNKLPYLKLTCILCLHYYYVQVLPLVEVLSSRNHSMQVKIGYYLASEAWRTYKGHLQTIL